MLTSRFRATAHGISAASGKAGAILAGHGFSLLKDIGGEGAFVPWLMWIFAGFVFGKIMAMVYRFMVLGGAFTFLVPETKGRTLEEISGELELE